MKTALTTTLLLFFLISPLTGQDGVDIRKYSLGFEGGLNQLLAVDRSFDGEQFSGAHAFLRPSAGIELRKRATRRMGWSVGVDFNWDKIVLNQFRNRFLTFWNGNGFSRDTLVRYNRTVESKSITVPFRVYFHFSDASAIFGQFAYGSLLNKSRNSNSSLDNLSSLDLGMNVKLFQLPKGDSLYMRFSCTVLTRWKVGGYRYWFLRQRITVGYSFGSQVEPGSPP